MSKKTKRHLIDKFLAKVISKKLLVWIIATVISLFITLDPNWVLLSLVYIGSQAAIDCVKAIKTYNGNYDGILDELDDPEEVR